MKVFQELRAAIDEWESSRDTIHKIAGKLNCSETEIMGKIEQLQTSRPANDLNAINDRLEQLQDSLVDAYQRAEDVEQQVSQAQNHMEYVDSNDASAAIDDVSEEVADFRNEIKNLLNAENE